ncbi:hypothetical protein [Tuwongella immobilis]|uniref:Uncharacterized protein n=1 Tax=Tuwongella immobilis TaxID=692036 RepID=A0A6C2YQJ6_9BACT|nr:hypothetical protein [Tuwongella immobilis]VIP03627.1 unnamed protein product [Tuwongella immobilis]VTS04622.1 unnamed protein product [Tuwongella immobilis]
MTTRDSIPFSIILPVLNGELLFVSGAVLDSGAIASRLGMLDGSRSFDGWNAGGSIGSSRVILDFKTGVKMSDSLFLVRKAMWSSSNATCLATLLPDFRNPTTPDRALSGVGSLPGLYSVPFQWEFAPHLRDPSMSKRDEDFVREAAFRSQSYIVTGDVERLKPPCLLIPDQGEQHDEFEVIIQINANSLFHFAGFQSWIWLLSIGKYLYGDFLGLVDDQTVQLARRLSPIEGDCIPFVTDMTNATVGVVVLGNRLAENRFSARIIAVGDKPSIKVGSVLKTIASGMLDDIRYLINLDLCTIEEICKSPSPDS